MDRDAFIAAMISQLQQEESLDRKAQSTEATVAKVCTRLCTYDFPEVTECDMDALMSAIHGIRDGRGMLKDNLRINEKFIENLDYISTHNRTPFVFRCLRSIFLELPIYFQGCNEAELRGYFQITCGSCAATTDWPELMRRYSDFCMTMSTSMLTLRAADDNGGSAGSEIGEDEILKLIRFLSTLRVALLRPGASAEERSLIPCSLVEYMMAIGHSIPVLPDEESEVVSTQSIAADLFFHVGFLIRDLMLLDSVYIPVCLPAVLDALGVRSEASVLNLSDAEQSMALLIIGSVIDSCSVDKLFRLGSRKRSGNELHVFLCTFLLSRIDSIVAICDHFIRPIAHLPAVSETEIANSSRQEHVYTILGTVGLILAHHDANGSDDQFFERAFVSSRLLDLLQGAAYAQIKQESRRASNRSPQVLAVLLLRYGARAAIPLLCTKKEAASPCLISLLVEYDEPLDSVLDIDWTLIPERGRHMSVSRRLITSFKAFSVSFLLGLLSSIVEILTSEQHVRSWLQVTVSASCGPALHGIMAHFESVLEACLHLADESWIGAGILQRAPVSKNHDDIDTLIAPTLSFMLQDISCISDVLSHTPRWLGLLADTGEVFDDSICSSKIKIMRSFQNWIFALDACSTSGVVPRTVDFTEFYGHLGDASLQAAHDDGSDWEWDTAQAINSMEGESQEPVTLKDDSKNAECVSTSPGVVQSDADNDCFVAELNSEKGDKIKHVVSHVSQNEFNSIRNSIKILKCTIEDISGGMKGGGVVKKID